VKPAILFLEFESIAIGIRVGDAMVKRAPLKTLHCGTVQPGRYLVLAGGEVADLEEARAAALEVGGESLRDEILLHDVHPDVVAALRGGRRKRYGGALGIFETKTVPAVIHAADRAVKGAIITILDIRLSDGLGGKGYSLFGGEVADVEAAIELAEASLDQPGLLVASVVIPSLHGEMGDNLADNPEFARRVLTRH
jgi:microcompartment protein CcmL/EutN